MTETIDEGKPQTEAWYGRNADQDLELLGEKGTDTFFRKKVEAITNKTYKQKDLPRPFLCF